MTKKVTGKDLKTLIEGVLNEKIKNQLVDPAVDLFTNVGKDKPPSRQSGKNDSNWRELGVKSKIDQKSPLFKKLAATSPTSTALSLKDLETAVADMITRLQTNEKPNDDQLKRDQAIAIMKKSASPELQNVINKVYLNYFKNTDSDSQDLDLKALTGKIDSYIDKLSGEQVTPFAGQEMPFKSLETNTGDFSLGKMPKANPSLVNLFGGIDGDSIIGKLRSIEDFSRNAQEKTLDSWAKEKDQFAPFVYSKVLSYLANEIKTRGSMEAGYSFEKWLALLLNFPVVGAENGAADNLGKVGAEMVYTSAKLYSNLSGDYGPSQSTEGLKEITGKGNKVYYFIGLKNKDSEGKAKVEGFTFIPSIDLYLVEISEEKGDLKGRFITDNATTTSKSFSLPKDKATPTQSKLAPYGFGDTSALEQFKFLTIYLPQGEVTENSLETTAQFLASEVNKIKDQPATQAIMDAATKIKKIEANTDSYVGKSKKEKGSATDYIKEITNDYLALGDLQKKIFQYGEGGTIKNAISETKKITSDLLKKIISESFKK